VTGVSLDAFLVNGAREVTDARLTLQWPERIKHLSATSLGMFRRCPEQFRHRYILGEKERPGEALVIGSMFHNALEWNYKAKIESHEDQPLSDLTQYLQDVAVPEVLAEYGGIDEISWDVADPQDGLMVARTDSERVLAAYRNTVTERIQPVAVEQEFRIPTEPVEILGYLDTCTADRRVIDTKTGKQVATKLKPSWMLQATLYSAATGWPAEYHSISRAAHPRIVTALESEGMIQQPNATQFRNVLASARTVADMISYLWTTLGPDQTWPTWGKFADWSMTFSPCGNCGWRKVCPAWAGEV